MSDEELKQKFNKLYKKRRNFYESHIRMAEKISLEYWQKNEMFQYYKKGATEATKELEAQILKMKCCGNCRFSESDKLNGTFCHREGCFVVASAKCKLWEN